MIFQERQSAQKGIAGQQADLDLGQGEQADPTLPF